MNFITSQLRGSNETHNFVLSHHSTGWVVTRRKLNAANIPPLIEIMTVDGWMGVLSSHRTEIEYFDNSTDAINMVTRNV